MQYLLYGHAAWPYLHRLHTPMSLLQDAYEATHIHFIISYYLKL